MRSNCYFLFFFVLFVSKVLLLFKYTFSLLECFRSRTHTQIHTHKHTKSKKYSYYNLVCLSAKTRVIFSWHIYSLHQLKTSFHYSNNIVELILLFARLFLVKPKHKRFQITFKTLKMFCPPRWQRSTILPSSEGGI